MASPLSALQRGRGVGSVAGTDRTFDFESFTYPANIGSEQYGYFVAFGLAERQPATLETAAKGSENRDKIKRPKGGVALYMPGTVQVTYSTQWTQKDTQVFGIQDGFNLDKAKAALTQTATNKGFNFIHNNAVAASEYQRKEVSNNEPRMIFQGVDFRTFNFEYMCSPRNKLEVENVKRIINFFKYNMLPTFGNGRATLKFPNEWDIEYFSTKGRNENLHRFKPSALTSFSVDYGPNGSWTSLEDGSPTDIKLSLTFQELSFLTKEDMLETGYTY